MISTWPTARTSATGASAKAVNQQAEPQAESAPTWALRQVVNAAQLVAARASSQPPCIRVCSMLVTTSVNSARTNRLGPRSAWLAGFTSTLVNAKKNPAARPHSAAGCTVARASSAGRMPRPASESHSTPATPTRCRPRPAAADLVQHDQREDGALHRLGLGIGRADGEAAIAEGHDQQVGAEDLPQPAGRGAEHRKRGSAPARHAGADQSAEEQHAPTGTPYR